MRHPAQRRLAARNHDVLFCCDPARWQNVKLVVEELMRRHPELRVAVAFPGAPGSIADLETAAGLTPIAYTTFSALPAFKTRILYLPAPDLPRYLRPSGAITVHALMSMAGMDGLYLDHHFDGFDYVLCGGSHHIEALRRLALRRPSLAGLRLSPAGYPKLDLMLDAPKTKRPNLGEGLTAVYAPTHVIASNERLASLRRHGARIVDALLAGGYRVIFRPHPISFVDEDRALVDRIAAAHAGNPKFSLDRSKDYSRTYASADFMVTDLSGTGFTYSLTFARPCLFFAADEDAERGLYGAQFDDRHRIGAVVRTDAELLEKAAELSRIDMREQLERFRDEFVFNVGKSAPYIVNVLEDILAGREPPDAVRL
ncbi:MAG: CDP-glycerol glycerophosphotransferase family protein [Steroidobacteraceae bacterium]